MAQIKVNGRDYELVTLQDLTLDEAIVVWEYAHVSLDQIPEMEGFHPGVIAALIHVSVARGEPGETKQRIRRAVGAMPMAELETVFAGISEEEDDEQLPPPPQPDGGSSSSGPNAGSGAASETTGEPPPEPSRANGSGSPGSATGATSDPPISVR